MAEERTGVVRWAPKMLAICAAVMLAGFGMCAVTTAVSRSYNGAGFLIGGAVLCVLGGLGAALSVLILIISAVVNRPRT